MPASCFGPYLRYAIETNFRNFENVCHYDEGKKFKLLLLVEFKEDASWSGFVKEMGFASFVVFLGPTSPFEKHSRYATARCLMAAVRPPSDKAPDPAPIWEKYATRVELSLPVREQPGGIFKGRAPVMDTKRPPILIGVLDDGCPFASQRFLKRGGSGGTRLLAIWDQNPFKAPVEGKDASGAAWQFGEHPADFIYGCEYLRVPTPTSLATSTLLGLNDWINRHKMPPTTGNVDESSCYSDAGFKSLKYRESHGAHVMDVLAGPLPTSSRISTDGVQPPTFSPATDPASNADIVFVQFSQASIEDPTGVWLDAYVLDGLRYILSCAISTDGAALYDEVIVNISYGRTTGPHNGSALLEQAMSEFAALYQGTIGKPALNISLAAGNYYLTENHVKFENDAQAPDSFEWTWCLPPDNSALCFAEIWMTNGDLESVEVTLTSPSGAIYSSADTVPSPTAPAGVDQPIAWGANDTMWRLQVEATKIIPFAPGSSAVNVVGEYGRYTIKVANVPPGAALHAYVARTDPNLNVRPGAEPSYFVDQNWEWARAASAGCTFANGEFDNRGSCVDRYGTLNGIATAQDTNVHVAGGYVLANARKSYYASAGPARDGPLASRAGPDFAMLCDESYALQGVPGGGNRSGVVFRLVGTSAAAPQLARAVANGSLGVPVDPPAPTDTEGIEQRGGGNLPAP